jgi:hypothetical protein
MTTDLALGSGRSPEGLPPAASLSFSEDQNLGSYL